jgi:hypothetical protein
VLEARQKVMGVDTSEKISFVIVVDIFRSIVYARGSRLAGIYEGETRGGFPK